MRGARPTMTMASQPQRLPARAKPLLASESLKRSVSGLRLTTANLAEVVSGLPTSGLKAKMSGASGESGSAVAPPSSRSSRAPRPLPPMYCRSTASDSGTRSARPRRDIDAEIAAVDSRRWHSHVWAGYPPTSAERISRRSSSASGVSVADERVAVQVGRDRRMQPVCRDELAKAGNRVGQRSEQLAEGVGLDLEFGDAGALARNAEKFNVHGAAPCETAGRKAMIAWAFD